MKSQVMTLVDALEVASLNPQRLMVSSEYLFNERHCYLRFNAPNKTLTQVFFEESKCSIRQPWTDYEVTDATENNLSTTFCPTYTDLVVKGWYVFDLVRPHEKADQQPAQP